MGAINSINVKWTGGGATKSFTNAGGEQNWTYVSGGTGLLAAGDYPGTGSTLQFLDSTVALPAANLPTTGTFALVVSSYDGDWTKNLTDFLGVGAWSYTSFVLSKANTFDLIYVDRDSAVGGTITVYGDLYLTTALVNATVTVKSAGQFNDETGLSLTKKITVESGGKLVFSTVTLALLGGCDWAGILCAEDSGILDVASPINATANGAEIDWNFGALGVGIIRGGLNANGYTVTHTNPTGAKLVCDQNGTLDLGADVALLDVEIAANVTLGRNLRCHTFTPTSGAIAFAGFKITCDHFVQGAGTFADSGIIDIGGVGELITEGDARVAAQLAADTRLSRTMGISI